MPRTTKDPAVERLVCPLTQCRGVLTLHGIVGTWLHLDCPVCGLEVRVRAKD